MNMAIYQTWNDKFTVQVDDGHLLALRPMEYFIGWGGVLGEFSHAVNSAAGQVDCDVVVSGAVFWVDEGAVDLKWKC